MNIEKLINILKDKCNEYEDVIENYEVDTPYWHYCRGKKDMIEDILAYISENF